MANDEMEMATQEAIQELRSLMQQDAEFAKAMQKFGAFIKKWYMRAGYKGICRWLKDGAN